MSSHDPSECHRTLLMEEYSNVFILILFRSYWSWWPQEYSRVGLKLMQMTELSERDTSAEIFENLDGLKHFWLIFRLSKFT